MKTQEDISGIPLAITNKHNYVFPHWINSDIKDAFANHFLSGGGAEFKGIKNCNDFGIWGWERRIDETIYLLRDLPRPSLITLATSDIDYTPLEIVEKVQKRVLNSLKKIY